MSDRSICATAIIEASVASVRPDPPDLEALTTSGAHVAIEATGYYADLPLSEGGGSALRAAQGQQSRIARLAQVIFEERNGMLAVNVDPDWATSRVLRLNLNDSAERIAQVVEHVIGGRTRPATYEFLEAAPSLIAAKGLPRELEGVSVLWGESVTQPMWESGFGGVMYGDPLRFARLIARKGCRRPDYAPHFDEAWLLIDVGMEGFGEISATVAQASYDLHAFDRVYFFDSTRLQVCRAVGQETDADQ